MGTSTSRVMHCDWTNTKTNSDYYTVREGRKDHIFLFDNTLNTFYVRYMASTYGKVSLR